MKSGIKISTLLAKAAKCSSITVSPLFIPPYGYEVVYFIKETHSEKAKRRTEKAKTVIEDIQLPEVDVSSVKHLGYNKYYHLVLPEFYIKYYKP